MDVMRNIDLMFSDFGIVRQLHKIDSRDLNVGVSFRAANLGGTISNYSRVEYIVRTLTLQS